MAKRITYPRRYRRGRWLVIEFSPSDAIRYRLDRHGVPILVRLWDRFLAKKFHKGDMKAYQKSVKALYKTMERILGPAR